MACARRLYPVWKESSAFSPSNFPHCTKTEMLAVTARPEHVEGRAPIDILSQ